MMNWVQQQEADNKVLIAHVYMMLATLGQFIVTLIHKTMYSVPAFQLAQYRAIFTLLFNSIAIESSKSQYEPSSNHPMKYLLMRGVFGSIGFTCVQMSLKYLQITEFYCVFYTCPIWTAIASRFILKQILTIVDYFQILLAFSGVLLVIKPPFLFSNYQFQPDIHVIAYQPKILGFVIVQIAVFAFTSSIITIKVMPKSVTSHQILHYFQTMLLVTSSLLMIYCGINNELSGYEYGCFFLSGFFTMSSQIFQTKALVLYRPDRLMILQYMGLIYSVIVDIVIFKVIPDNLTLIGAAMIFMVSIFPFLKTSYQKSA